MWKPIRKFAVLPAGLLLVALATPPAGADSYRIDDNGGKGNHVGVNEFQVADNDRHGRDDDRRGWDRDRGRGDRGRDWNRGRDDHRGPRNVIIVRPAPRYVYPAPRVIYRDRYAYAPRPYYSAPAANFLGAFAGAVVGGIIGSSMDRSDHVHASYALETSRIGYRSEWRNPDSGYDYAIVPTRTFENDGQFCREYTTWGRIGGREEQLYGQACRMPDGSWRFAG